jgi:hypothetical protein
LGGDGAELYLLGDSILNKTTKDLDSQVAFIHDLLLSRRAWWRYRIESLHVTGYFMKAVVLRAKIKRTHLQLQHINLKGKNTEKMTPITYNYALFYMLIYKNEDHALFAVLKVLYVLLTENV